MTQTQFNAIIQWLGWNPDSKRARGCQLVFVHGMNSYAAAEKIGCSGQLVDYAVRHFPTTWCNCCNQPILEKKKPR